MSGHTTPYEARGQKRPDVVASDRASWVTRSMPDYDGEPVNRTDCKPWRDENTLQWAYCTKELSTRAIGQLFGKSHKTIQYWMEKYGIDRDPGPNRSGPWRDEQTLYNEYVEKENSMNDLAERWDTSTATIFNWLEQHGIDHRHDQPEGEDHPMYIDGRSPGVGETEGWDLPERECEHCGRAYKPCDHRQEYCSRQCAHELMRDRVRLECEVCGEEYDVPKCRVDDSVCCSYDCLGELNAERMSEARRGEGNPNWEGGHSPYYGPSWQEQRRRALKRDNNECQVCGRSDDVHVHHIRPFRKFGVENHAKANALDNLVCLCPEHHAKWEGIPLRPQ